MLGSVTIGGSGTFTNYTGGTTLNQGTFILNRTTPFGTSSNLLTLSGAVLEAGVNLSSAGGNAIPNPVTIGNSFVTIQGTNPIEFAGLVGMAVTTATTRLLTNNLSGWRLADVLRRDHRHGGFHLRVGRFGQYAHQRRL